MSLKLSTGEWTIDTSVFRGATIYEDKIIMVPAKQIRSKDYLDTCVHEAIHASRRDLSEETVVKLAGDITQVLWAMGYRKKD